MIFPWIKAFALLSLFNIEVAWGCFPGCPCCYEDGSISSYICDELDSPQEGCDPEDNTKCERCTCCAMTEVDGAPLPILDDFRCIEGPPNGCDDTVSFEDCVEPKCKCCDTSTTPNTQSQYSCGSELPDGCDPDTPEVCPCSCWTCDDATDPDEPPGWISFECGALPPSLEGKCFNEAGADGEPNPAPQTCEQWVQPSGFEGAILIPGNQGHGTVTGPDPGPDTDPDPGPDTDPGTGPDTGPGMGSGTWPGRGTGTGTGTRNGTGPGTGPGTGHGTDSDTDPDTGPDTGPGRGHGTVGDTVGDTGSDTGPAMGPGTVGDTVGDTGSDTGPGMGPGTWPGKGTGKGPGTGPGTRNDTGPGTGPGTGHDTDPSPGPDTMHDTDQNTGRESGSIADNQGPATATVSDMHDSDQNTGRESGSIADNQGPATVQLLQDDPVSHQCGDKALGKNFKFDNNGVPMKAFKARVMSKSTTTQCEFTARSGGDPSMDWTRPLSDFQIGTNVFLPSFSCIDWNGDDLGDIIAAELACAEVISVDQIICADIVEDDGEPAVDEDPDGGVNEDVDCCDKAAEIAEVELESCHEAVPYPCDSKSEDIKAFIECYCCRLGTYDLSKGGCQCHENCICGSSGSYGSCRLAYLACCGFIIAP